MALVLAAEFDVEGIPVPQGSKNARVVKPRAGGPMRAVLFNDNDKVLKPWRALVTATARAAYSGPRLEGALAVWADFRFVRPPSVKPLDRAYPTVKPDVDKLLRALFDGITDAGVWRDDAQVIKALIGKDYDERPGVRVRIGEHKEREALF